MLHSGCGTERTSNSRGVAPDPQSCSQSCCSDKTASVLGDSGSQTPIGLPGNLEQSQKSQDGRQKETLLSGLLHTHVMLMAHSPHTGQSVQCVCRQCQAGFILRITATQNRVSHWSEFGNSRPFWDVYAHFSSVIIQALAIPPTSTLKQQWLKTTKFASFDA